MKLSSKQKVEKEIKEAGLNGQKVEIFCFPARTDTSYLILRPSQESRKIQMEALLPEMSFYLKKKGFLEKKKNKSILWDSPYGLSIYFGRLDFQSYKSIKIMLTGEYLIYKDAEKYTRRIALDLKKLAVKHGILLDGTFSRVDASFLIIADDIHDILPNPEKENLTFSNSLDYHHEEYKDEPTKISAMRFSNSKNTILLYDKEYELKSKVNDHSKSYHVWYSHFVRKAHKLGKKLFRLELRTYNQDYLHDFTMAFFAKSFSPDKIQKALCQIFSRFIKFHSYRKLPDELEKKNDRRNSARWKVEPISHLLFYGGKETSPLLNQETPKMDFKYKDFNLSRVQTTEDLINRFARELAKTTTSLDKISFNEIKLKLEHAYENEKHKVQARVEDKILRQTRFRSQFARSKAERELIEREKNQLVSKLGLHHDHIFTSHLKALIQKPPKHKKKTSDS